MTRLKSYLKCFTWNGQHCTIDRKQGKILERGEGDDALLRYDGLVPLKLIQTSTILPWATEEEGKELKKKMDR
jgi:hypothetical protein